MCESVEGKFPMVSAEAAISNTSKWKRRIGEVEDGVVHDSSAGSSFGDDLILDALISGEAIQG